MNQRHKISFFLVLTFVPFVLQNCDEKNADHIQTTFNDVTSRGYSHSVVVDQTSYKTVYISGQIPVDANGRLVGQNNLEAQTEQVFKNIDFQLNKAGGRMDDVVSIDCFFTDISKISEFRKARDKYINLKKPPASTAVQVERLINEEFLIEINAIAVIKTN